MNIKFNIQSSINKKLTIEQLKMVLFKSMLKMHELAVIYCPVDKGGLRASINLIPFSPGYSFYELATTKEYAEAVEFGTAPHIIRPVNGKALKFKADGKTIFAKKVNHPGTRAQPYFRPSLDQVKQVWVPRYFNQVMKKSNNI